jgi:amino acid transporter
MSTRPIVLTAMAAGVMLSPDSLVLLGNGMGAAGVLFLTALLTAAAAHFLTALSYGKLSKSFPGRAGIDGMGNEAVFLKEALGPVPAIVFPLCSRALFAVCAAAGVLVTAGFVFNEVFLYWFPNFGFAFGLLGVLLAINILRVPGAAQVVFVATAVFGLAILSFFGLAGAGEAGEEVAQASTAVSTLSTLKAAPAGLLLFMGYDLGERRPPATGAGAEALKTGVSFNPMTAAIVIVGVLFCLWGLASVRYVPLEKLSETTIPHTVAAREILGHKGRMVMGAVAIAGTCGAVNALFASVSRMLSGMAFQGLLPRFLSRPHVPVLVLAGGAAAMMGLGMAGEPLLEILIMAGLCFWLLNYCAAHLSAVVLGKRIGAVYRAVPAAGMLLIFAGLIGLFMFGEETALLGRSMLVIVTAVLIFSLLWVSYARKAGVLATVK